MHNFILFIKEFHIYKKSELINAIASFSKKQLAVFMVILLTVFVLLIILLGKINQSFMVEVPVSGGSITEGIVGVPTLVNPVSSFSNADKDLTILVYSGLMRKNNEGEFIPDLAESFPTISPNGLNYTFILKKDLKFHNGMRITVDDIIFTIEKIKNSTIKSPRKMEWDGVTISKIDENTIMFTLSEPYISFLDNTTLGILSSQLWKDVKVSEFNLSPLNTKAIGSGPYKIKSVIKDENGLPEIYKLERFNNFSLGKPLIKKINIISYANEKDLLKALLSNSIDQAGGINPENANILKKYNHEIHTATLPRIFGVFLNKNNNKIFGEPSVIEAIDQAIDRQMIIDQVLLGYGSILHNPIPPKIAEDKLIEKYKIPNTEEANNILEKAGWTKGEDGIREKGGATTKTTTKKVGSKTFTQTVKTATPKTRLSFSIITGDTSDFKNIANLIKDQLVKIGVEVNVKIYETGQLNQLIKDREYEALLFGQSINHESNIYSYWHSSQATDPGLNIAMYNNKKVDVLLETIQKTLKVEDRINKYLDLGNEFNNNIGAVLIYSPLYLYATSPQLKNIFLDSVTVPSDRFSLVYKWAANTDKVWKIFNK